MRRKGKDRKGEGKEKEPGQAEPLGYRRHTQGGPVKDGTQKSHVELKESRKQVKVPEIGSKVALLLPEEGTVCEETHKGQYCERRAIVHRVAAAEKKRVELAQVRLPTGPLDLSMTKPKYKTECKAAQTSSPDLPPRAKDTPKTNSSKLANSSGLKVRTVGHLDPVEPPPPV